jgi:hypothetical protein
MEQEKCQRFSANSHVVFSSETVRGEGRLENLSAGGAAVLTELAIARGEYLGLKITCPSEPAAIDVDLAPVRWVKEGSFRVKFIRISPDAQQRRSRHISTR